MLFVSKQGELKIRWWDLSFWKGKTDVKIDVIRFLVGCSRLVFFQAKRVKTNKVLRIPKNLLFVSNSSCDLRWYSDSNWVHWRLRWTDVPLWKQQESFSVKLRTIGVARRPGLTSQRRSVLISSDSEYFQVCFSAVHYLKISEQRWFSSEQRWKRKFSELKISAETALFQRLFSLKQRWFRADQLWFSLKQHWFRAEQRWFPLNQRWTALIFE